MKKYWAYIIVLKKYQTCIYEISQPSSSSHLRSHIIPKIFHGDPTPSPSHGLLRLKSAAIPPEIWTDLRFPATWRVLLLLFCPIAVRFWSPSSDPPLRASRESIPSNPGQNSKTMNSSLHFRVDFPRFYFLIPSVEILWLGIYAFFFLDFPHCPWV